MIFSKTVMAEAQLDENYWSNIFKRVFGGDDGKKALLYIFQKSGMFEAVPDKDVELFLSGKRALALEILELLQVSPADLVVAQEEAMNILDRSFTELDDSVATREEKE